VENAFVNIGVVSSAQFSLFAEFHPRFFKVHLTWQGPTKTASVSASVLLSHQTAAAVQYDDGPGPWAQSHVETKK
jgi:hypothetical protein